MSCLKIHCLIQGHKDLCLFCSTSFIVLTLTLSSLSSFELVFCIKYMGVQLYSFMSSQLFQLKRAIAPRSSTLAWKIPWTEEPGRLLQSMGSLRVGHDWATSLSLCTFMHWRRKWQPTPVFLPGESQGWGSLVGYCLWGHRVGHDWSDLAATAAEFQPLGLFAFLLVTSR